MNEQKRRGGEQTARERESRLGGVVVTSAIDYSCDRFNLFPCFKWQTVRLMHPFLNESVSPVRHSSHDQPMNDQIATIYIFSTRAGFFKTSDIRLKMRVNQQHTIERKRERSNQKKIATTTHMKTGNQIRSKQTYTRDERRKQFREIFGGNQNGPKPIREQTIFFEFVCED